MKARLPKGMGGGPQNMNAMIRQAQKMQEDMKTRQEEIEQMSFKTTSGGGMVEVEISGKKEVKSILLKPEVVDPEDMEEYSAAEMDKITGSLNIPGVF